MFELTFDLLMMWQIITIDQQHGVNSIILRLIYAHVINITTKDCLFYTCDEVYFKQLYVMKSLHGWVVSENFGFLHQ